jgi:hypothetical protein
MTEGFIESGVQGIFLTVEKQPTPASVQATGQQSVLFFNFANCVNSTAGTFACFAVLSIFLCSRES